MCSCPMVGTSQQGDRWWLELTVDSATTCWSRADLSTLSKDRSALAQCGYFRQRRLFESGIYAALRKRYSETYVDVGVISASTSPRAPRYTADASCLR